MDSKIVGLDIGRGSAVACIMEARPVDLPDFIRKYKPAMIAADPAGLAQLLTMGEIFALEPTGKDHRWWANGIEAAGKQILLTPGVRIRNHARGQGVLSKGDKEDAAVIPGQRWLLCQRY
jgi:transposase